MPILWWFALALALRMPSAAQGTGVLYGQVRNGAAGLPIEGAAVELAGRWRAVSDSLGHYRIVGVPRGRHFVVVRHVGFAPESVTVDIASDSTQLEVTLTAVPTPLPSVEVSGARTVVTPAKLAGFEERRRTGIGRFLTETQIEELPGTRLSDKIRQLPGIRVVYPRTGASGLVRIASNRGSPGFRTGPCFVRVVLDGANVGETFNVNSVEPGEVTAIEWYAGPSQTPALFNTTGNACGVLVIWTK